MIRLGIFLSLQNKKSVTFLCNNQSDFGTFAFLMYATINPSFEMCLAYKF